MYSRESRFCWLWRSLALCCLCFMFGQGCTLANTPGVSNLVARDIEAFVRLTEEYGSDADIACASLLERYFNASKELAGSDADGILSFAYRIMLLNRLSYGSEQYFAQHCGQFAVEWAAAIARFRR